jgi:hypothetical protein
VEPLPLDANGWARGLVEALPEGEAWTLLSPEPEARIDAARWAHQAATFFRAELSVVQDKRYPSGAVPLADCVDVQLRGRNRAGAARVRLVTLPIERAPEAMARALAGARAIGGAGFDAILPRTRRAWQVSYRGEPTDSGEPPDPCAPLAIAAVLASLLLAPIVPPEGGTIFGVKGARERLSARGFGT